MGGMPNVAIEGKRPMLVLERQPPLPRTAPMRLVAQEEDKEQEKTLVLVMPYGEEDGYNKKEEEREWTRSNPMNSQEQQFNIDYNMLVFIARQGSMIMELERAPNLPLGPCYNCSSNHLINSCPHPRQPRQVPMENVIPTLAR